MTDAPPTGPGSRSRAKRSSRAGGAGVDPASGSQRRTRAGGSRPSTGRPGTAPPTASTSIARRPPRGSSDRPAATARTFLPQSALARQVAVLGLVLCAIALSVAFPLRNYLEQRAELGTAVAAQAELERQRAELEAQQAALQDPAYVALEARRRLQFVLPGDTVFVVHSPVSQGLGDGAEAADRAPRGPWYTDLWHTVAEDGS